MTDVEKPRCTARSVRTGERCRRSPINGGDVCATHGGRAPQVKAAAARRLAFEAAKADAAVLLAHEGYEGVTDPVAVLARLATEADAFRGALARRVNALNAVRFTDDKGGEQLRAEVALYERALDRTARFCESLARLGFAERELELGDRQAHGVAFAVAGLLEWLAVQSGRREEAQQVFRELMRRAVREVEAS